MLFFRPFSSSIQAGIIWEMKMQSFGRTLAKLRDLHIDCGFQQLHPPDVFLGTSKSVKMQSSRHVLAENARLAFIENAVSTASSRHIFGM